MPGIFFFIWFGFCVVAAIPATLVLVLVAVLATRGIARGRGGIIAAAAFLPLASVIWIFAVFFGLGALDSAVLDRDAIFTDAHYTPLAGGYSLAIIDGQVAYVALCHDIDSCNGSAAPGNLQKLQVAAPYILGVEAAPGAGETRIPQPWFLFDTDTDALDTFPSAAALSAAAKAHGIALDLRPVVEIYNRYRWTWVDWVGLFLALAVPAAALVLGVLWVLRRRARHS